MTQDSEVRRQKSEGGKSRTAAPVSKPDGVRLQKIIAGAGVASRRAAETLMQEGRVTVNGAVVSTLGARANPDTDDIRVDGRRVGRVGRRRYLLLNKPRGVMTTRDDPQRRRTVMDLLTGVRESVYPVGRLDYDTTGLLLLTNDGDLAARLTHPRHGVERVYEVRVRGVPDAPSLKRLARGVVLDGRRTAPATANLVGAGRSQHANQGLLRIVITEGRKRQVRQMCEAIGHPVVRLRRVRIGPIQDTSLRSGQFRDLTPREVTALRRAVELVEPPGGRPAPTSKTASATSKASAESRRRAQGARADGRGKPEAGSRRRVNL
jgi:pseudouridine synthase